MNESNNLIAHTIPLKGKHLIEASAGTGKTYNITRLYLRMLLERQLTVQQILVMTFTKDATEELRARIDSFIRLAINQWSSLIIEDPYFRAIAKHIDEAQAQVLLRTALLNIDEAAIFTIHGFCKRVLNQHAFASGIAFNALMESNSKTIELEACQDWYRILAKQSPKSYLLVAEFWSEPTKFLAQFSKAISKENSLDVINPETIVDNFIALAQQALNSLELNKALLIELLVKVKKGEEAQSRLDEFERLLLWLSSFTETTDETNLLTSTTKERDDNTQDRQNLTLDVNEITAMPDAFIDGRRYSRSKEKNHLVEIFKPVNEVKALVKKLGKLINKAQAFVIVREAIYKIRADIANKKQKLNMLNFDDLISTLANTLKNQALNKAQGNEKTPALAELLYQQFPVALVDEFQDTDPQQFTILKAIYYHQENGSLFMIGDPKQAIYGFRGGDVFAYLSARKDCDFSWLMDTNWRSTPAMVTGYNRLFYGDKLSLSARDVFGYQIPYLPVKASPVKINQQQAKSEKTKSKDFSALQFVHFSSPDSDKKVKQSFRPIMAKWCASEISRLLNPSDSIHVVGTHSELKLKSQDIAILVRDGSEAAAIKLALQEQGLSSVFLSNRANLLHSKQAQQLLVLLKGLLFIENERLFTTALACGLLGFTPLKLYQLQQDELAWQELKFTFTELREQWRYKGFISVALKLMHEHFKLVHDEESQWDEGKGSDQNGGFDRTVTNLLHLFELLQSASQRHRQPQELIYWFEQQISLDNPESEAELRLESDDDLIRIITQHGSKGLEYPIVFIPFATRHKDPLRFGNQTVNFIEYHDEYGKLHLSLDGSDKAKKAMADESYGESIRLLYVAITRAEQRCYILSTAFEQCHLSPLGQTLKWQKQLLNDDLLASLQVLVNEHPEAIGLLHIQSDDTAITDKLQKTNLTPLKQPRLKQTPLEQPIGALAAKFNGKIERDWWLSSFSALSKNLRHVGVSSPDRDIDAIPSQPSSISSLLRFNIAKGAHTGNLLHDILEHTDFVFPDWHSAMQWPLVKYGDLDKGYQEGDLKDWLTQILHTPLKDVNKTQKSGETEGFCLNDISTECSLRETEFYFPMESASSDQLTQILSTHRRKNKENSSDYVEETKHALSVRLPAYKKLKGMMHGFIDLIFEHQGKYYVCDYKSSHLGDDFDNYRHSDMLTNIEKNHYDLQYLIYSLALHRHLKFSLVDYDASVQFGGVYYLYLRGMSDNPVNQGSGVYFKDISLSELDSLDCLFSGSFDSDIVNSKKVEQSDEEVV